MQESNIVVGKRVPVGAVVGAAVTAFFAWWNTAHPESTFSPVEIGSYQTLAVFAVQIFIANKLGVTTPTEQDKL